MNTWIEAAAAVCAASFIVVLAVSAYWDPSIRVLHVFEAVPYAAAGVLCLRQNKLGYALGFVGGPFGCGWRRSTQDSSAAVSNHLASCCAPAW